MDFSFLDAGLKMGVRLEHMKDGQKVGVGKLELVFEHAYVRPASQPQPFFDSICFACRQTNPCFDKRIAFRSRMTKYDDDYQSVKVRWVWDEG